MNFGMTSERKLIFLDSETCGLHGMMVLLQYAEGKDGKIIMHEVWKRPVGETLALIEHIADNIVVGFNLVFDWFHLCKIHTIWSLLPPDWIPEEHIEEIAMLEPQGRDGKCLKPFSALDLMLVSRKGPYQSLMARSDIVIRRIPLVPVQWQGLVIPMAYAVASYLEQTVELDGIYFARTSDPDAPKWTVVDREKNGKVDREFADVVLRFHPDGSLKSLAEHALKMPPKYIHSDIALKLYPCEDGYAPFALAIAKPDNGWAVYEVEDGKTKLAGHAWPAIITKHIEHWHSNEPAREYAYYDIVYTRGLYYHFGEPAHGDVDSILSCMVPAIRWWGFEIDQPGIAELREHAIDVITKSPINTNKPDEIRRYIGQKLDDTELSFLEDTTKKSKLEEMSQWVIEQDEFCMKCMGQPGCTRCSGDGTIPRGIHPAAPLAKEILGIKIAAKELELYNKLLQAGRFHASFKITGTLSNRMAGADGLNPQGIKHDPFVRSKFPMRRGRYVLCGGDFDSFEVTLADAVYNDPDLRKALVSNVKIHAMFGTLMYPGFTYEQILDSEKHPENYEFGNMYGKAKSGVFAMIYGGNAATLNRNLGIPMETAERAYKQWGQMFPGIAKARERIINSFQPLLQPEGIGKAITWVEPKEYVESFLGFRRYFTLEYKIVKALFRLAQHLPAEWRKADAPVIRSEKRGVQKAWGALSSALYGAAFAIAEANVRAAANHEIQSPGADITKAVQVDIWTLQPHGVHEFVVAPMNVHDEIISVTLPEFVEAEAEIVKAGVERFRPQVPLIGMKWCLDMENWAEKKGGDGNTIHITYDRSKFL